MIKRELSKILIRDSKSYPVVTLTGPRQSGKTTLVKDTFKNYEYLSLENLDNREFAKEDPNGFLNKYSNKVIFDEIQHAPEIFSYIQTRVDERDKPGQYILTGSQNFLLLSKVSQTLAGRCSILHLLPFSMAELNSSKPFPINKLGVDIPNRKRTKERKLFDEMLKGFYPRVHAQNLDTQNWFRNYYQTYLERDIRDILNVGDIETFGRFIRLCAGRNGQLLNLSSLAIDCGITHTTARRWLSVLEASFLVLLLRPHFKNFSKRLIKSPKIYFIDTGLLCYLLRIRNADDLRISPYRGGIFESLIISELYKNYFNQGKESDLYFWRDSAGHEIDILIDKGNDLFPIEIKSGETIAKDFFDNLEYWKKISGKSEAPTGLIYGGDKSFIRKGTAVYSWLDL